jgi:hypothetical protein
VSGTNGGLASATLGNTLTRSGPIHISNHSPYSSQIRCTHMQA